MNKKRIFKRLILLSVFLGAALFQMKPEASILNEDDHFTTTGEYMVVSGGDSDFLSLNNVYYDFYDNVCYYITSGTIDVTLMGTFGSESINLEIHTEMEDDNLSTYTLSYQDIVYYEVDIVDDSPVVQINKEIDFCYLFDDYDIRFKYKSNSIFPDVEFSSDEWRLEDLPENLLDYFLAFLKGGSYHINEAYIGSEPHITMEYDHTITLDDIKAAISITDLTEGEISSFEIIDNTYDEENPEIGEYSMRVVAKDSSGNTSIQKFYVNIVDIKDPVITADDFSVSYTHELTEEEIYSHIHVEDKSDCTKTLEVSSYTENYSIPGEYEASVTATDIYGNDSTESFTITVKDDIPPVLGYPNSIDADTLTLYDEDYIRLNYFEAIDAIDGDLTDEIVFTDVDDYAENYKTPGLYHFKATVSDTTGNDVTVEFVIHSIDNDYPEITINQYTVFVAEGEKLTREKILAMLEALGRSTEGAEVECSYFYEESPSGVYDLSITYPDGTVITDRIITYVSDISMDIPEVKKTKSYTKLIIFCSLGAGLAILFSVMGVVIYRKRH